MLCQCLIIPFLCTGYLLSCLPYVTEDPQEIHDQIELIKNLKLKPDFIINIKVKFVELKVVFCSLVILYFFICSSHN